jgi:hypothetical protein
MNENKGLKSKEIKREQKKPRQMESREKFREV